MAGNDKPCLLFRWNRSGAGSHLRLFVAASAQELHTRASAEAGSFHKPGATLRLQAPLLLGGSFGAYDTRHLVWRDLPGDWPEGNATLEEVLTHLKKHHQSLWDNALKFLVVA